MSRYLLFLFTSLMAGNVLVGCDDSANISVDLNFGDVLAVDAGFSDDATGVEAGPASDGVGAGDMTLAECGVGLVAHGSACIPLLDRCSQHEVPLVGGGCKRVGIVSCEGGIQGPDDATCQRIGVQSCLGGIKSAPTWECAAVGVQECPGGLLDAADGTCKPIGAPTTCVDGWTWVGGYCQPILPTQTCPAGTMQLMGEATCQPIRACGDAPYGDIQLPANALHVDQAYDAGGSDGTADRPYTTLGSALAAAPEGATIAIAAGSYKEHLIIGKAVVFEGRCPQLVTIEGQGTNPTLELQADTTLRGLTLTGGGSGLRSVDVAVTLEGVAIIGCAGEGLAAQGGSVTLMHSLIAENHHCGADLRGAHVTMEKTVVRDTRSDAAGVGGMGIQSLSTPGKDGELTLNDCVVASNISAGILVEGSDLTLNRTLIRSTQSLAANQGQGLGIQALATANAAAQVTINDSLLADNAGVGLLLSGSKGTLKRTVIAHTTSPAGGLGGAAIQVIFGSERGKLDIEDSLLVDNPNVSLAIAGSDVTLQRTVVRDTRPQAKDNNAGIGVQSGFGIQGEPSSTITLTNCLVAHNRNLGMGFWGAKVTLERTIVRDTKPQLSNQKYGSGIRVSPLGAQPSELTLRRSVLANNHVAGIFADGRSKVLLERSVVRDTQAQVYDGKYGHGIVGIQSSVTLQDSLVERNRYMGINLFGSEATVNRSIIRDTLSRLSDGEFGYGIEAVSSSADKAVVTLTESLIANNHAVGVHLDSADATVERSIIRDTQPKPFARTFGKGIEVLKGDVGPGSLIVRESLISSNRDTGVAIFGSKAHISRTVVRDTLPRDSDLWTGVGIGARSWAGSPAELTIEDALVLNNTTLGIRLCGSSATVKRTVVAETRGRALDGMFGHGVGVNELGGESSVLTLSESVIVDNRSVGVSIYASTATIEGSVIRDTRSRVSNGRMGLGIQALGLVDEDTGESTSSQITLRESVISGSHSTGILVASSKALVERSIIRQSQATEMDDKYGDGLTISLVAEADMASLDLRDSLIDQSTRAGLLFLGTEGTVSRSLFRQGAFSIVVKESASPLIGEDNMFEGNTEDGVVFGKGLEPTP
ncbi:MAG: right-handed parallel beta-helix repeat-containing protein, partial [Deltaproteobacteria bacterium]|nr:right-handed parallel beta-helix repeat-containing protein [Deltaproteobacteria bacterium]